MTAHGPIGAGWLAVLAGSLIVLIYEWQLQRRRRHQPLRFARAAHARLREEWTRSLMQAPGNELLAVQTIRNSVMSATVTASAAVLALTGALSLVGNHLTPALLGDGVDALQALTPRALLAMLLIGILFAALAASATAVRYFNHAGYLMSSRVSDAGRARLTEFACQYMVRAGNYYSRGLRTLLLMTPVAAGLLSPWLMPPAALALVLVLHWFDRAPAPFEHDSVCPSEVKP